MRGLVEDRTPIVVMILSRLELMPVKSSWTTGAAPCLTRPISAINTLHMVDHKI